MIPEDDPRLEGEYVRRCTTGEHEVLLVGVVHDHPASKYRVRARIENRTPDILALELPPGAVPLFEKHADDSTVPPARGGEMSAAIQALPDGRVVGIDGPSLSFIGTLLKTLFQETPTAGAVRNIVSGLVSVSRDTLVCRLAALVPGDFDANFDIHNPVDHDCETAQPGEQAEHERRQISRARSIANAFEQSPASRCQTLARNREMASHLETLRREGSVVAVVGIDHLDDIERQLSATRDDSAGP